MTKLIQANTEEWLVERQKGIGASEAAAAVGLSRYKTALHLYHEKRGNVESDIDPEYAKRGHDYEEFTRQQFINETGLKVGVRSPGLVWHPEHSFMFATPDFPIYRGSKVTSALECKTLDPFNADMVKQLGDEGTDQLPDDWICQTQQQMACMELDHIYVAVLVGFKLRIYNVPRNEELIATLTEAEAELWERIENADPPPPDYEHTKTLSLIKRAYGVDESKRVELEPVISEMWKRYEDHGKTIRELEKYREGYLATILHAMGDAHIGTLPGGEREIVRTEVAGGHVSYERKPYIKTTCRKVKKPKGEK